jgi:hypothetical protein
VTCVSAKRHPETRHVCIFSGNRAELSSLIFFNSYNKPAPLTAHVPHPVRRHGGQPAVHHRRQRSQVRVEPRRTRVPTHSSTPRRRRTRRVRRPTALAAAQEVALATQEVALATQEVATQNVALARRVDVHGVRTPQHRPHPPVPHVRRAPAPGSLEAAVTRNSPPHPHKTQMTVQDVLVKSWTSLVLGSGLGFLGTAFAHANAIAKLTVYALLLNVVGRSGLVRDVQPTAAVLGLLMLLTYWTVLAAAPDAFLDTSRDDEVADTAFADAMVHLVLPLDAALAARYTEYAALAYTLLLSTVYAVVFVATDPYPSFAVSVGGRVAMAVGGVLAACGTHALFVLTTRCVDRNVSVGIVVAQHYPRTRPPTQSMRTCMSRDLRRASESTLDRPWARTTSASVRGVLESRRTRGRHAFPSRSRLPHGT